MKYVMFGVDDDIHKKLIELKGDRTWQKMAIDLVEAREKIRGILGRE